MNHIHLALLIIRKEGAISQGEFQGLQKVCSEGKSERIHYFIFQIIKFLFPIFIRDFGKYFYNQERLLVVFVNYAFKNISFTEKKEI